MSQGMLLHLELKVCDCCKEGESTTEFTQGPSYFCRRKHTLCDKCLGQYNPEEKVLVGCPICPNTLRPNHDLLSENVKLKMEVKTMQAKLRWSTIACSDRLKFFLSLNRDEDENEDGHYPLNIFEPMFSGDEDRAEDLCNLLPDVPKEAPSATQFTSEELCALLPVIPTEAPHDVSHDTFDIVVCFESPAGNSSLKQIEALGIRIQQEFSGEVSHVLFDVLPKGVVDVSKLYLYGAVTGAHLLSTQWLKKSFNRKKLLAVEPFKLSGCNLKPACNKPVENQLLKNPNIFAGILFHVLEDTNYELPDKTLLTRDDILRFIELGGGTLTDEMPDQKTLETWRDTMVRFHAPDGHRFAETTHIIIHSKRMVALYRLDELKTLSVGWLIEAALSYELS